MSENRSSEGMLLNWRGPLLAASIFAIVFAVLLLMAHQNESKTSDMGSSLRQDPYGASLLFDSYQRAGYQVERSQDENSLSDRDALQTTAFFIGGYPMGDFQIQNGKLRLGEKFRVKLEDFLARGGRVVLVEPAWQLESASQGWKVENEWHKSPSEQSGPAWISPNLRAMPAGSEKMYLASDAPWLKTDEHWTPLYAGPESANAETGSPAPVYMAMRRAASGELLAASQESFLLNETIKTHPNPVLLDFLAGGRPLVWVDETLHGLHQEEGVLWLIERYRLQVALLLFWATLLVWLWSLGGGLVRRPAREAAAEIVRSAENTGVAARRLLQRSIAPELLLSECWGQFRRRSPQDALAISADPYWGPRLRAALAQSPLEGYQALARLIAERRALTKGLARPAREEPGKNPASPKTISGEVRTA